MERFCPHFTAILIGFLALQIAAAQTAEVRQPAITESTDTSTRIGRPLFGHIFDAQAGGIRAVHGFPGAAFLGSLEDVGATLAQAAVSQRQDYILAQVAESGELGIIDLAQGTHAIRRLADLPRLPDAILLSSSGRSATILYREQRKIVAVTDLPAHAAILQQVDLASYGPNIRMLGVSDDAKLLLFSASVNGTSTLYLKQDTVAERSVGPVGEISAALFLSNDRDVVIADRISNQVNLLRDVLGSAEFVPLVGSADGISEPQALAVSGKRLWIANSSGRTLTSIDLDSAAVRTVSVPLELRSLTRLGPSSVFLLTDLSQPSLLVLDDSIPDSRVFFVPKMPNSTAESRETRAVGAR